MLTQALLRSFQAVSFPLGRSEVLGLKWEAINFDKGILSVCRKITSSFDDGHEQLILEMQYYQILKSDFDRTFDGFVCRDNTGATITPEYVTRHFRMVIKKYKLRPLRFHDLRHSCASLLLASGVSMKAIQDWLGHSTFNVTFPVLNSNTIPVAVHTDINYIITS